MNLKHLINKKTLLMWAFLTCFLSFGQEKNHFCGQTEHDKKFYLDNPNLAPDKNPAYKELEEFTNRFKVSNDSKVGVDNKIGIDNLKIGSDYIIPVVVHVIHNNGIENLSDPAIKRAIDLLNYFFSGVTANDAFIDTNYKNIRGVFTTKKLRFVLAKFDPNGKPTNGIDRYQDAVYTMDSSNPIMRNTYNWPRANYFNIYVVTDYSNGTSGFATFPAAVASQPKQDGHVMCHWAFGEHSNMVNSWTHNLNHEVGHWLNLYHIWGANSINGDVNNCSNPDNDSVPDTPLTKGNIITRPVLFPAVNPKTCGEIEDLTNMMDYTSGVYASITNGQKARMEAALNSSVSDRNKLWSTANVLAKLYGCTTAGTDTDGDLIPDACDVCPISASSDSDGDGVCDNLDSCPGLPDVNVDANPLAPDACDPLTPIINFNNKTILKYDAPNQDKGLHVTYDGGATLYTATNAWKAVDLNYTVTPNTVLEFDFMSTIDGEDHSIGIDDNLTMNPLLSFKLYGTKTITTTAVYKNNYNTYTGSDRYTYKHYKIPVGTFFTGSAPYLFFTCNNDAYIPTTFIDKKIYDGNGKYNDGTSFFRNVKMYENAVLSTANFNYEKDIYFYPNPTNNSFKIVLKNNMSMDKIMIYDVQGRVVYQKDLYQSNQEQVDINYLETGVYHVKIETNKGVLSKKVIKN